ncbi:hypothetical protein [Devosia sp. Root105]|uniref:hypothetical protein n=1 Tax=Devosia sp. Root105 TaxID=1736423 RepID=UPI000713E821|nr:hypothetical protein [Devosia sp. Root105]KQU93900.1 hypothetical protein ASC68_19650 [Devosia sp. Root105]
MRELYHAMRGDALLRRSWALLTAIAAILNVPLMLLSVAGFLGFNLNIFVIADFLRAILPVRLTDFFVHLDSWMWGNLIAYVICASLLFYTAFGRSRFFLFRAPGALLIIPFFFLPALTVAFTLAELLMTTIKGCWWASDHFDCSSDNNRWTSIFIPPVYFFSALVFWLIPASAAFGARSLIPTPRAETTE